MLTNIKRKHRWTFAARFREDAFGWRSQPAIARIQEALSEIKKEARKDPILGAEGAVMLVEKLSPALMHVDSSSGAIGQTVYNAIDILVKIIADAPADNAQRDVWLERLSQAVEKDDIPYLEHLPDHWGDLCATSERASRHADEFLPIMRIIWGPDRKSIEYFKWISACLSCLFKAGRFEELLDLLKMAPHKSAWHDRQWGVKALVAMGKSKEALEYAENSRGLNDSPMRIAIACESILLSIGLAEEAYQQYAFEANRKPTYLATFRAIAEKYPHKGARQILHDLVDDTPGEEGKWFAAATSAGLYDDAIALVSQSPCDPKTLIRAAKSMEAKKPDFAIEAGLAALHWLVEGYGYDVTSLDVLAAYRQTRSAAEIAGRIPETMERIRKLLTDEAHGATRFVTSILGRELG